MKVKHIVLPDNSALGHNYCQRIYLKKRTVVATILFCYFKLQQKVTASTIYHSHKDATMGRKAHNFHRFSFLSLNVIFKRTKTEDKCAEWRTSANVINRI